MDGRVEALARTAEVVEELTEVFDVEVLPVAVENCVQGWLRCPLDGFV